MVASRTMKKLRLLLLVTVFLSPVVSGQSHTPGNGGPDPANIPAPTAPTAPPAGVPMLPFHFGTRPLPPLGQKFGNVAAVAFTPEGHLLVFNRKFFPHWEPRYVIYQRPADLPRVGLAGLAAEGYLPYTGTRT